MIQTANSQILDEDSRRQYDTAASFSLCHASSSPSTGYGGPPNHDEYQMQKRYSVRFTVMIADNSCRDEGMPFMSIMWMYRISSTHFRRLLLEETEVASFCLVVVVVTRSVGPPDPNLFMCSMSARFRIVQRSAKEEFFVE